mgnify:CR=1 FL=1
MGERTLGSKPVQESWEIYIGRAQGRLIQLGYEGVSLEHVLEKRLKGAAYAADARTVHVLDAVETAAMYLKSARLVGELGERAVLLLERETGGAEAPEVFDRVRRLVGYYRTTPGGLPSWLRRFVTTGYSHYASLLPVAHSARARGVSTLTFFTMVLRSPTLTPNIGAVHPWFRQVLRVCSLPRRSSSAITSCTFIGCLRDPST